MKKYLKKGIGYLITFILIFLFCFKVVDMHSDGVKLRNGTYSFSTLYKNETSRLVVDVNGGNAKEGTVLQLWPANYGAAQQFTIENLENDRYVIRYQKACLGVDDKSQNVIIQSYESQESQQWYIERIGSTQYFKITNCESGLSMCVIRSKGIQYYAITVAPYEDDNIGFYFQL